MSTTPSASTALEVRLRALMCSAQAGNAEAYEQLLLELQPVIRVLLPNKIFNATNHDDVAQDILLSVHLARDSYEPTRPFLPWLRAIVRHRCIDHIRRHRANTVALIDVGPGAEYQLQGGAGNGELAVALRELSSELADGQQQLLAALVEQGGADYAELADSMGIAEGNLRVQIHRLFKRLREVLE